MRHARPDEIGRQERTGERDQAGEDERPRDTRLRVCDGSQRLGHADRHRQPRREVDHALEQPQAAEFSARERRVAGRRMRQSTLDAAHPRLLGGGLDGLAPAIGEQLCAAGTGPGRRHDRQQERRCRSEGLLLQVAVSRLDHAWSGLVVCGVVHLAVDLGAQLRPAATVDDDEGDRGRDEHHGGHPCGQAPAKSERRQASSQRRHCQASSPKR